MRFRNMGPFMMCNKRPGVPPMTQASSGSRRPALINLNGGSGYRPSTDATETANDARAAVLRWRYRA